MGENSVVHLKRSDEEEDKPVIMTIRINRGLQKEYDKLTEKSSRSRDELISMTLRYVLVNPKFVPDEE